MFGKYFYNKNIRNVIVLFGTVFNDITIKRTATDGTVKKQFKVPIAYGPAQKYLTILEQGQLNRDSKKSPMTLPRMSFEITTMVYDATRKLQTKKRMREAKPLGTIDSINLTNGGSGYTSVPTVVFQSPTGTVAPTATAVLGTETNSDKVVSVTLDTPVSVYQTRPNVSFTGGGGSGATAEANLDASTTTVVTAFNPVPYNFDIDLSIMVKNSDDGAQILEQILPYFTPEYHVTLNEMSTLGVKRDIPIVLTAMNTEDSYEGDFVTRRALIHTLSFTVQAYLYGPSQDQGIIREVDTNISANTNDRIDANVDVTPNPIDADPDDDFGFTATTTIFE